MRMAQWRSHRTTLGPKYILCSRVEGKDLRRVMRTAKHEGCMRLWNVQDSGLGFRV